MNRWVTLAVLAVVAAVNYAAWWGLHRPEQGAMTSGRLDGLSYAPFREGQSPQKNKNPSDAEITDDMIRLRDLTSEIRTYSSTNVQARIAQLAAQQGLHVTAGAWVSDDVANNQAEVAGLIRVARTNLNVPRVLVGNEAILRADIEVPELIRLIRHVRRQTGKPVSTAEPWHVWHDHPELAAAVDYIAVHILPYWEGAPVQAALEMVFERLEGLKAAYPGKPIVITEVGWPSIGRKFGAAVASVSNQAWFVREFVSRAEAMKLDYFVIEAFDQPWKIEVEGRAGAYWGIYDQDRKPKFAWQGPIERRASWPVWAAVAVTLGLIPAFVFLRNRPRMPLAPRLGFAVLCQAAGAAMTATLLIPFERYLGSLGGTVWGALFLAQCFLFIVMAIDAIECVDILADPHSNDARRPTPARRPKVSIHVAAYNEPPAMMRETLMGLARLDYPDFEVLVIDNNTKDPAVWRPVEEFCKELGPRFRFFHLEPWPGFKAGALNFALRETARDAEVIAVIDADYIVSPDWLSDLVPHFDDAAVGIVQAPQDYRDASESLFKAFCFWEYTGFFRIGMITRARDNAIIQHGTMTMVRRRALEESGGWSEWCITEDAELGLRLFERGWRAVYTPRSYGRGVMPDTLDAYVRQRFRWAYGAVQILKRHWRELISPRSGLTFAQRYHFIGGWIPWWSDAIGLLFSGLAFLWTIAAMLWPKMIEFPDVSFVIPALSVVVFKVLRDLLLYRLRVKASFTEAVGAMIAGLALTHTVGKAMVVGLFTSGRPFLRTPKCENRPGWFRAMAMARNEATILVAQLLLIAAFASTASLVDLEARLWLTTLCVLTLPYIATVAMSLINATGVGATWKSVLARANSLRDGALGEASRNASVS